MLMKLNYLQKPKLFIIFASIKTLFLCENMKQKDQHLVTEIFKNYTLNDFLKEALKQKKITEEEMVQTNEKYKSESESISDVCLRKIETAFQEIKTKTKDQPWWKYQSSLPSISDVMYEIKYHYDDDDILETFEFKQRCDVVDRILHSHLYYEKPAKTHYVCIDIRSVFKRVSLPARYHLFTSEDDDHQQDTIDMFSINRAPAMVA